MPQNSGPYLIIAQSGRALAASAYRAGIQTHVIDRFADTDTKKYALSTRVVNENESGICVDHLRSILADFSPGDIQGVVTGSGLENQPDILNEIDEQFKLIGNKAECVRACKDPNIFFPILDLLEIPYPDIKIKSPENYDGWLVKRIGGSGGHHIKYGETNLLTNSYYQKFVEGRSLSVTFVADGNDAYIVGFNETWVVDIDKKDFRHHGAVITFDLSQKIKNQLENIISKLVKELHLIGICGLDVIIDRDGDCYVLEINPRAVSTIDLYEQLNLFQIHLEICEGIFTKLLEKNLSCFGYQIYYSSNDFSVPDIQWPNWVVDRPRHGVQIASGAPICTIRAAADTPCDTRLLLDQRKIQLSELITVKKAAA